MSILRPATLIIVVSFSDKTMVPGRLKLQIKTQTQKLNDYISIGYLLLLSSVPTFTHSVYLLLYGRYPTRITVNVSCMQTSMILQFSAPFSFRFFNSWDLLVIVFSQSLQSESEVCHIVVTSCSNETEQMIRSVEKWRFGKPTSENGLEMIVKDVVDQKIKKGKHPCSPCLEKSFYPPILDLFHPWKN